MKKTILLFAIISLIIFSYPNSVQAICIRPDPPYPGAPECSAKFYYCHRPSAPAMHRSWCCTKGHYECLEKSFDPGGPIQPEECSDNSGIMTNLGCIPTKDTSQFIGWLLRWAIGLGGGIAFILIIFASFQIITSSGDPQKLQGGKELLGSALAGLFLIIFSLVLLQLIGVRILEIPGFGLPEKP